MVDRRTYNAHDLISYGIILIGIFLIFTISISNSVEQITAQESEDSEFADQGSETDDEEPETDDEETNTGITGPENTFEATEGEEEEDQFAEAKNGEVETPAVAGSASGNGGDNAAPPSRTTPPEEREDQGSETDNEGGEETTTTTMTTTPSSDGDVGRIFRSTTEGFQVQVPIGWVVEDIDNTSINAQVSEEQSGYTFLARICAQEDAIQVIGGNGGYQCEEASTASVGIMRFSDLYERPEFVSRTYLTTSDLLLYYTELWQSIAGISNIQIWNDIDRRVNILSPQTNQTVATAPAKLTEYTYLYPADGQTRTMYREFTLLLLNEDTGYALLYKGPSSSLPSGSPSFHVQQIFDSFELLQ